PRRRHDPSEPPRASLLADELRASPGTVSGPAPAGEPGPAPGDSPVACSAIRCDRPSCQPRCSADMVCRISAGLGPGSPGDLGDPETPPDAPLLASVVRRFRVSEVSGASGTKPG